MLEKTLVLIKPEAIERALVGKIISRFERSGLYLEEMKILKPTRKIIEKHSQMTLIGLKMWEIRP